MVGVDVGGTFTDAVQYDAQTGELTSAKAPSTLRAPAEGVLAAMDRNGIDLGATDRFVHGVTIGTTAILERRGAPVRVITTCGFCDTLEVARTNRTVLYDIKTLKPASLVPRQRVIEVDERVLADGSVVRVLDPAQVRAVAARLRREAPAAVAVCFLHGYINPAHEEMASGLLREALPEWFVCHAAGILPQMCKYERFNTTVLNAHIGPLTARYVESLSRSMRGRGYRGAVHLMASSGGIETAERAAWFRVHTVLSGPAADVAAAIHLGAPVGARNFPCAYDIKPLRRLAHLLPFRLGEAPPAGLEAKNLRALRGERTDRETPPPAARSRSSRVASLACAGLARGGFTLALDFFCAVGVRAICVITNAARDCLIQASEAALRGGPEGGFACLIAAEAGKIRHNIDRAPVESPEDRP